MFVFRGVLAITAIALATIGVWLVFPFWIVQLLWARGEARSRLIARMDKIIIWWTRANRRMIKTLRLIDADVVWHVDEPLSAQKWYLVVCNHQSWTDILLLQTLLWGHIPPLKFFTKAQLIWIPFIGIAMYLLGFPYVKRVTRDQIKAKPELRHADRDYVLKACEGFKNHPTSILNFVEGTRNTEAKRQRQGSEYKHLLRPKTGGIGYVIQGMGPALDSLIDVTIVYPDAIPTFWEFLQGKCRRVTLEVRQHPIPADHFASDSTMQKTAVAQWIKSIWQAKDARLTELKETLGSSTDETPSMRSNRGSI
tara:strand:- start:14 stop:940 length:927 start_codon:yes stop_codon:yes gene_type:complete